MKEEKTCPKSFKTIKTPFRFLTTTDVVYAYFLYCAKSMIGELDDLQKERVKGLSELDLLKKCVKGLHQHRMQNDVCKEAAERLQKTNILNLKFVDFEELYCMVKNLIKGINGIGDLTVYDTSKRIGHLLAYPVYPEQYVYSVRGAAVGAEKLLGRKVAFREPISEYTPYFNIPSLFIEDILCIFKDYLTLGGINTQTIQPKLINKLLPCCGNGGGSSCYTILKKQKFILTSDEES